jgi:transcriptional regulator with XRE-family HTH domain
MNTIGYRVKLIRKRKSLTQEQFSSMLAVSRPYISNIESDKKRPPMTLIKLICYEFNVPESWLISGAGTYRM